MKFHPIIIDKIALHLAIQRENIEIIKLLLADERINVEISMILNK